MLLYRRITLRIPRFLDFVCRPEFEMLENRAFQKLGVRLSKPQGLCKLKNSFTSSGLEPATLRLVA
jgi:hypothetical protein